MPSSANALRYAGVYRCSECGLVLPVYGPKKHLCEECAAEAGYWIVVVDEASQVSQQMQQMQKGGR